MCHAKVLKLWVSVIHFSGKPKSWKKIQVPDLHVHVGKADNIKGTLAVCMAQGNGGRMKRVWILATLILFAQDELHWIKSLLCSQESCKLPATLHDSSPSGCEGDYLVARLMFVVVCLFFSLKMLISISKQNIAGECGCFLVKNPTSYTGSWKIYET